MNSKPPLQILSNVRSSEQRQGHRGKPRQITAARAQDPRKELRPPGTQPLKYQASPICTFNIFQQQSLQQPAYLLRDTDFYRRTKNPNAFQKDLFLKEAQLRKETNPHPALERTSLPTEMLMGNNQEFKFPQTPGLHP